MRTRALAARILNQIRHDKRTLAFILVAPLLILTIVYFVFNASATDYTIGVIQGPDRLVQELRANEDFDLTVETGYDQARIKDAMGENELVAAIKADDDCSEVTLYLDGTDASTASKIKAAISKAAVAVSQEAVKDKVASLPIKVTVTEPDINAEYIYGSEDNSLFDNFGAPLIGIIIFFLVFLIAGINFLNERKSGTLEKLLSTPIRRGEIIGGYVLGFGILAAMQSILISVYVVYVLELTIAGSIWNILLVNLLTAMSALTLGILLSTLARNEFQMLQFIPVVILPQIFLCGLFDLSGGWDIAGHVVPLYYTTDALTEVMLRGSGLEKIWSDCLILAGYAIIFMLMNVRFLKKQRKI